LDSKNLKVVEFKPKVVEGEVTPKSLSESLLRNIEDMEVLITISQDVDGVIRIGWTKMGLYEVIGFLECAKDYVMREIKGDG
jgi:hypothetical protein